MGISLYLLSFCKNVVFPAQAEYSYFSADFRLKIFLHNAYDFSVLKYIGVLVESLTGGTTITLNLIFWLCNMKQLKFGHFNTNSKKFTVNDVSTVNGQIIRFSLAGKTLE